MIENFCFGWIFYNMLALVALIILNRRLKVSQSRRKIAVGIFCFLFAILGIFGNAITPDYPNYEDTIKMVQTTKDPFTHFEWFWIQFIRIFGHSFLEYRIVLMTLSFGLLYFIVLYFEKINPLYYLASFTLLFLYPQIGLRSILFLMVYTLVYIYTARGKIMLALLLLVVAAVIHKAGQFGILIYLLSWLKINTTRKVVIYILGFACMAIGGYILLHTQLSALMDYAESENMSGSSYLAHEESNSEKSSLIWLIIEMVTYGIIYFLSILILKILWKYRFHFTSLQLWQYKLLFWSSGLSLAILFTGLPDRAVAYRCGDIGSLSLCYLWTALPQINRRKYRKYKYVFIVLLLCLWFFRNIYIRGILNRI